MKRKHQKETESVVREICQNNSNVKKIIVSATPGAGKSSIPIIATKLIDYNIVDKIAWVVPRSALQDQGERTFIDPFFRELFDHNHIMRCSTNDIDPCRGTSGFITTYQALGVDKNKTVENDFKKYKYCLILDEFHHVEVGGIWEKSLLSLYKRAEIIILMTGTLERGDRKEISFIEYYDNKPVLHNTNGVHIVQYTRSDALREKAILPISFSFCDANLEWISAKGTNYKIKTFKVLKKNEEMQEGLFTALNSDFFDELLSKALKSWTDHKYNYPSSKLLIVTDGIDNANKANRLLKQWGVSAKIATSHESKTAQKNIKEFKCGLDVLVTIAMAYEGLDVPEISHIAALTNIRSKPWIEQMVARGVRIDKQAGSYEQQTCYVFAPADPKFLAIAKQIEKEQILSCRQPQEKEKIPFFDDIEFQGIDINNGVQVINGNISGENNFNIGVHSSTILSETVSEKEIRIRNEIKKHLERYCKGCATKITSINSQLKKKFGKPRSELYLSDLIKLQNYIEFRYRTKNDVKKTYFKNDFI